MTQKVGGTQLTYTETSAGLSQGKKYYVSWAMSASAPSI